MSELVELQDGIVKIRESEVRCNYIGIRVVSGVLNGCEIIYLVLSRNNYDSARVLTRSSLYAYASSYDALHFGFVDAYALALEILGNEAEGSLVCKRAESSCSEHVLSSKELLGVFMHLALNVSREVKVDIWRFISVEAKEGLKRNIVSVGVKLCVTMRTVLIGKIKARAHATVCKELGILTLRTVIVRGKRIYLGDSRHRSNEGRAH